MSQSEPEYCTTHTNIYICFHPQKPIPNSILITDMSTQKQSFAYFLMKLTPALSKYKEILYCFSTKIYPLQVHKIVKRVL